VAVKLADAPEHIVTGFTETVGIGFIVMVETAVAVQLLIVEVYVTEYVAVVAEVVVLVRPVRLAVAPVPKLFDHK
jgi:hypothetical protein